MMDIVERLRKERELPGRPITKSRLCYEAADEIERLRAALEEIKIYMEHRYQSGPMAAARRKINIIVDKALKQSEKEVT